MDRLIVRFIVASMAVIFHATMSKAGTMSAGIIAVYGLVLGLCLLVPEEKSTTLDVEYIASKPLYLVGALTEGERMEEDVGKMTMVGKENGTLEMMGPSEV